MTSEEDKKFPLQHQPTGFETKRELIGLFKQGPLETQRQFAERVWREFQKAEQRQSDEVKSPCPGFPAPLKSAQMRRTLLAVGVAVLVSMLLAPHGNKYGSVEGFGPFFSNGALIHPTCFDCWYRGWWGTGIFYGAAGRVMIDMLALETVFLAVLFAVLVNLRKPQASNKAAEKRDKATRSANTE